MQEYDGFIKFFRKFKRWGWYTDTVVKCVFIHCLLSASYTDFEWLGKTYGPGQFVTSIANLSNALKLSPKQIRTALDKLCSTNDLGKQTTNKFTVITVIKWSDYQGDSYLNGNQRANKEQSEGKQTTNKWQQYKNIKNNKNKKNINSIAAYDVSLFNDVINAD